MRVVVAAMALLLLGAVGNTLAPAPAVPAGAAAAYLPDDPGWTGAPGGWATIQWDLAGPTGVDAPGAWGNLLAAGAPGGRGVTVAVLDTGVAADAPDLAGTRFVSGYDFVDDDADPEDENGHGTHVAATIAARTGNGVGLAGLAYGVDLMPVRVLDGAGSGEAATIARGLGHAVDHGADVVNLSLNFGADLAPAERDELAGLADALEAAHAAGVLVVVGTGNTGEDAIAYPASAPHVLAVGATTDSGCLASYSNHGAGLDLVAPGGGSDGHVAGDPDCQPGRHGDPVYQTTFDRRDPSGFGIVGYEGTSMAAPHVSATAALVIASGVVGEHPTPAEVTERLEQTARDLGPAGHDTAYGWGLVDAAAATTPGRPHRPCQRGC
jgi:serine protease